MSRTVAPPHPTANAPDRGRPPSHRRVLAVALVLVLVAGLGVLGLRRRLATPNNSVGQVLGVYTGATNVAGAEQFSLAVGHQLRYATDYLDGTSWATIEDPRAVLGPWSSARRTVLWGVPILPNTGATLAQGAAGAYDGHFRALAGALVAGGQAGATLRLGWEFNGNWFPWSANGQAERFVGYYRRIVTAMRSVPGTRFRFVWNPTQGDQGVGDLADYYPGDGYVDIVGLDVYDSERGSYPGAVAEWQHLLHQPFGLEWLARFATAHAKPMSLPEWGLGWGTSAPDSGAVQGAADRTSGGDNPYFIEQMGYWITAHRLESAIYWDYGSSAVFGGANPRSGAALRRLAR